MRPLPAMSERLAVVIVATIEFLFAGAYITARLTAPYVRSPSYADFDGPALARMAETYWRERFASAIPYLIDLTPTTGRQMAGSIVFDSRDRPHVLDNGDLRLSPWIDVADLKRHGALVVTPLPIPAEYRLLGNVVEDVTAFDGPTLRPSVGAPPVIYFGLVRLSK